MQLAASRPIPRPVSALTPADLVRPTYGSGRRPRRKPHPSRTRWPTRASPGRLRPRYAALRDRHRRRPRPVRPRDRPVRGRRGRRRRHPRAHRGGAPRRRPRARLRLGADRRPDRRDPRDASTTPTSPASARPPSPATPASMRSVAIGDTGRRALVYGTRTHYYEGRGVRAVVHGVRTAAAAGCTTVVLTNGCGGLRPQWAPGTPVLISDHINLTATSPIEGAQLRRPHRPLLAPAARRRQGDRPDASTRASTCSSAGRTTRPRPRCGWPASSAATWSACRPRSRRSPPARAASRCSASRWSPTRPPGISTTPLNHEEVLEAGREAADRCGRLLAAVVGRI